MTHCIRVLKYRTKADVAIRIVEYEGASIGAIIVLTTTIEPWITSDGVTSNPYISHRLLEIPFFITITPIKH
jgi:hypothetical protein